MERDDLRVWRVDEHTGDGGYDSVSDADLASLGHVKLDGIDVEALKPHVETYEWWKTTRYSWPRDDGPIVLYELARQVLAAIDQEGTP